MRSTRWKKYLLVTSFFAAGVPFKASITAVLTMLDVLIHDFI